MTGGWRTVFAFCLLISMGLARTKAANLTCDFDKANLCDWKDQNENWEFSTNNKEEYWPGPLSPVGNSGKYIFSRSNGIDKVAVITSPIVEINGTFCLTFHYHVFGIVSGSLRLVQSQYIKDKLIHNSTLWARSGTTADRWYRFRDTVSQNTGPINAAFSFWAEILDGDAALDNLEYKRGPCQTNEDFSCDFESGTCGWDAGKYDFQWERFPPNTESDEGIIEDHTTSSFSGHFMTVAKENMDAVREARLLSPMIEAGESCFSFWYFLKGSQNATLKVTTLKPSKSIWEERGNASAYWTMGRLDMAQSDIYQVTVSAIGEINPGEIGFDDSLLKVGKCGNVAECDFNYDMCGYSHDSRSDFRLLLGVGRLRNRTSSTQTPPKFNDTDEMYLYADTTVNGIEPGQSGRIVSEIISNKFLGSSIGCLTFRTYLTSEDGNQILTGMKDVDRLRNYGQTGSINIMKRSGDWDKPLFANSSRSNWETQRVTIDSLPSEEYRIVIELIAGHRGSFAAINDVRFSSESCEGEDSSDQPTIPPDVKNLPLIWDCNFEEGNFCNWTKEESWQVKIALESVIDEISITSDHTLNNAEGIFAYLFNRSSNSVSSITSEPIIASLSEYCVSFWYWMHTSLPATLSLYLKQGMQETKSPVWVKRGTKGIAWNYGSYNIPKNKDVQVIIRADSIRAGVGDIAIDDIKVYPGKCVSIKGTVCDFESNDICGMRMESEDGISWERLSGPTETNGTGPKFDHTYGTKDGHYMVLQASKKGKQKFNNKALLIYPDLPGNETNSLFCLRFYFHMLGANVNRLNLYVRPNDETDLGIPIWSQNGQHSNKWAISQANINSNKKHDIIFEAVTGYGDDGDIAIDDILLLNEPCPLPASCDFESDFCAYENLEEVELEWIRWKGPTPTQGTGPDNDHTEENIEGYYVYLDDTTKTNWTSNLGVLQSEYLSLSSNRCLRFWAHMYGSDIGTLSVNVTSFNLETNLQSELQIWSRRGDQGNRWFPVTVSLIADQLTVNEEYRLKFAGSTKGEFGNIAIDDIFVESNECYPVPEKGFDCKGGNVEFVNISHVCDFHQDCESNEDEVHCGACDFEHDFCLWSEALKEPKWRLSISNNQTVFDLPKSGASTRNEMGNYAFLAGFYVSSDLLSPQKEFKFKRSDDSCRMRFWYYMFEKEGSRLTVKKIRGGDSSSLFEVIGASSDTEGGWQKTDVLVGTTHDEFSIKIGGSTGLGPGLAIDDIFFKDCAFQETEGDCNENEIRCNTTRVCIKEDALCDLSDDCGDGSDELTSACPNHLQPTTFERGDMGLFKKREASNLGYSWEIASAAASRFLENVGPINDHTLRVDMRGQYLYVQPQTLQTPKEEPKAQIIGPNIIKRPNQVCSLRFYYYLYGNEDDSLVIYRGFEESAWDLEKVFSKSGSHGQQWVKGVVPIKDERPFHFVIEGTPGMTEASRIAIDDISFSEGCDLYQLALPTALPSPIPTKNPCRANEFKCGNDRCIDLTNLCDFTLDCTDGTDEIGCGPCSFDDGLCGWENEGTGLYSWLLIHSKNPPFRGVTLPADRNDGKISYVFSRKTRENSKNSPAKLSSPNLPATSTHCLMIFYMYYASGNTKKTLTIELSHTEIKKSTPIKSLPIRSAQQWNRMVVPIPSKSKGAKITFTTTQVNVIIDDISFLDCDPKRLMIDCDFDDDLFNKGLCYWKNDPENKVNWKRRTKLDRETFTGPNIDHTSGKGFYLYISQRNANQKNNSRLISPKIVADAETSCFSFWYHMYGRDVASLSVILLGESNETEAVWKQSGDQGNKWLFQELEINRNDSKDFHIVMEALVSTGSQGIVAIDDTKIINGVCPDITVCDFENGLCGWSASPEGPTGWSRETGTGKMNKQAPMYDHSLKTEKGHFLIVRPTTLSLAVLTSSNLTNVGYTCLHTWYNIYGPYAGEIHFYQKTFSETRKENTKPIAERLLFRSFVWRRARITLPSLPTTYFVTIEAKTGVAPVGYIALDDLQILDGECTEAITCNFEMDECGWTSTGNSGIYWVRRRGIDKTFGAGPPMDNTLNNQQGYYMFLNLEGVASQTTITLESEEMPYNEEKEYCFSTSIYLVNGTGLNIHVDEVFDGYNAGPILPMVGLQSDMWHYKETPFILPKGKKYFEIQFSVQVGQFEDGTKRSVAIDDVKLLPYKCGSEPEMSSTQFPITTPKPSKFNCDFEVDLCNWHTPDPMKNRAFKRYRGHSSSKAGGRPRTDRTTGSTSGHYVAPENALSITYSPKLQSKDPAIIDNNGSCLKFSYYMHGGESPEITFSLFNYDTETSQTVWKRLGSQGPTWNDGMIRLSENGTYYLTFQGTHYENYYGTTALDDIVYTENACPPHSLCDFESDDCGYHNVVFSNPTWSITSGSSSRGYGPTYDRTLLNAVGKYYFIDGSKKPPEGAVARLESGNYAVNLKCLQFWYYHTGNGTLRVFSKQDQTETLLWNQSGDEGPHWHMAQISAPSIPSTTLMYIFEGVTGKDSPNSKMAIDDLRALDSCSSPGTCDFEIDSCAWYNDPDASRKWVRESGETENSGPARDKTLGTQFGAYLYSYWNSYNPATFRMFSSFFIISQTRCIEYWYFRNGTVTPVLGLIAAGKNGIEIPLQMFSEKVAMTPDWVYAQKEISLDIENWDSYRLIFQANFSGDSRNQFLALDDIEMNLGNCPSPPFSKDVILCDISTKTVPSDKICDFYPDCVDGLDEANCGEECNFETDTCDWKISTKPSTVVFFRQSANRTDPFLKTDHTMEEEGQGYFLTLNETLEYGSDTAEIYSPDFIDSSPICSFSFWYFFRKPSNGVALEVFIEGSHHGTRTKVFRLETPPELNWHISNINVGRVVSRFKVVIAVSKRFVEKPGILVALDDFEFGSCASPRGGTAVSCPDDEFLCSNKRCVKRQFLCDYNDDCGDYSDEFATVCDGFVARCDFERNFCDWRKGNGYPASWAHRNDNYIFRDKIPERDHTKNTFSGKYVYFKSKEGDTGQIFSPVLNLTGERCQFRFFYQYHTVYSTTKYQEHPGVGSLSLYLKRDEIGALDPKFTTSKGLGYYYEKVTVDLTGLEIGQAFQIYFEATAGADFNGAWVLDDVSFSEGCQISDQKLPKHLTTTVVPTTPRQCERNEFACVTSGKCILMKHVCDFLPQCPDGSDEAKCAQCNFDDKNEPLCGWRDTSDGRYGWKRFDSTPSYLKYSSVLQPIDVLGNNGSYLFVDTDVNKGLVSKEATLESPKLGETVETCKLGFVYYMGVKSGDRTSLLIELSRETEVSIWMENRDTEGQWLRAYVPIRTQASGVWSLRFKASIDAGAPVLGIDDIVFENCPVSDARQCQAGEKKCANGMHCVSTTKLCDFNFDCPDMSDETDCSDYIERCDFEKGLCNWQRYSSSESWELVSGRSLPDDAEPQRDHTSGTSLGRFLYIKFSKHNYISGSIQSTEFQSETSSACQMRFWYHLLDRNSKIVIQLKLKGEGKLQYITTIEGSDSSGDDWNLLTVPIIGRREFRVIIEGQRSVGSRGGLAIDDVSFTPDCVPTYSVVTTPIPTFQPPGKCNLETEFQCLNNRCVNNTQICDFKNDCATGEDERTCPDTCNFEDNDWCGWREADSNPEGYYWNVTKAEDSEYLTNNYPVIKDVTLGTDKGHFLFLWAKRLNVPNKTSIVNSPSFIGSSATCKVSFYYFIKANPAPIKLVIVNTNSTETFIPWYARYLKQKNMRQEWLNVTVGVGRREERFGISFQTSPVMPSMPGSFAVDEIRFVDCALPPVQKKCPKNAFKCANSACIDKSRLCNLIDDCGDRSDEQNCSSFLRIDFENGTSIFQQGTNGIEDQVNWEIGQGSLYEREDLETGPVFDHTTFGMEGHYLYVNRNQSSHNERAWLKSWNFKDTRTSPCAMTLHYYMFGQNVNKLTIYTKAITGLAAEREFWSKSGEQGNFWNMDTVLFNETEDFQIIIEGKLGVTDEDAIAIDDVSFTEQCGYYKGRPLLPDTTSETPETTSKPSHVCSKSLFSCATTRECLRYEDVCNLINDCGDGSDERNCVEPECDFEDKTSTCGWIVAADKPITPLNADTLYVWRTIQAKNRTTLIAKDILPDQDKTINNENGRYLYADSSYGKSRDWTTLSTPSISRTGAHCTVEFWTFCGGYPCSLELELSRASPIERKNETLYTWVHGMFAARNKWSLQRVFVGRSKDLIITFRSNRKEVHQSAIALDALLLAQCAPPQKPLKGDHVCGENEAMCDNTDRPECIDRDRVCDFTPDCTDESDEANMKCQAYQGRCNFSVGFCPEWRVQNIGNSDWKLRVSAESLRAIYPQTDHTSRVPGGKHLSVPYVFGWEKHSAYFASFVIKGNSKNCKVRFWYNIIGVSHQLDVYRRTSYKSSDNDAVFLLESLKSEAGIDFWDSASIIASLDDVDKDFEVVFVALVTNEQGSVNIDDISLTPSCEKSESTQLPGETDVTTPHPTCGNAHSCRNGKCFTRVERCNFIDDCGDGTDEENCGTECDFEEGMCGWYNQAGLNYQWNRVTPAKSKFIDAPETDHTLKKTEAYYLSSFSPYTTREGDIAHLHSPTFVKSGKLCNFTLWYFMNNRFIGNLTIYSKGFGYDGYKLKRINLVTGKIDPEWLKLECEIGSARDLAVIVEASYKANAGKYGISLDDFKMENCEPDKPITECANEEWQCSVNKTQCIPIWEVCDIKTDCNDGSDEINCDLSNYPGSCNFDKPGFPGSCPGWIQFEDSEIKWTPVEKATTYDSQGKESYLHLSSLNAESGWTGAVGGPIFKASEDVCHVTFRFSTQGSRGQLQVLTMPSGVGEASVMWHSSGAKNSDWKNVHVAVGNTKDYRVVFEGTVFQTNKSDMSIDWVKFTKGCVEGIKPIMPTEYPNNCENDEFDCGNEVCVPKNATCDCLADCEDGSDENDCDTTCPSPSPETDVNNKKEKKETVAMIVGIFFGTAGVLTIVFIIAYNIRKRRARETAPMTLDNPLYGVAMDEFEVTEQGESDNAQASKATTPRAMPGFSNVSLQDPNFKSPDRSYIDDQIDLLNDDFPASTSSDT